MYIQSSSLLYVQLSNYFKNIETSYIMQTSFKTECIQMIVCAFIDIEAHHLDLKYDKNTLIQ
jgi:hypothetical protein